MKTLTIRLTAPLQSYGNQATFNKRTSNYYPSKSAVIGMIAASLGYRRNDSRIAALNKLHFGVRIDQPGKMMEDFQIVEYPKTANKTARKLTYRDYIQDAVFVVAISSDDEELVEKIAFSLRHPKFQLYLGRRSNPPAGLLQIEQFSGDLITALKNLPWQASRWYKAKHVEENVSVEIVTDGDLLSDDNTELVKDEVGSFDEKSRYHTYRAIAKTRISLLNDIDRFPTKNTNHDVMDNLSKEG